MSDNWVIVVPADPFAAPPAGAVEAARSTLEAALPEADEVVVERTPDPHFVDAGGNFQSVSCPACGTDAAPWWGDAMDAAFANRFRDLSVTTPCCGHPTTLNDLVYDWPQAFARVSIEAMNPNVMGLDADLQATVEHQLGVPTKIIWTHV